ncbi:hypothetical protein CSC70_00445 [Pseudoxanthomonas kalamensis DSM 18571]|uniref:hypothetical protein n=1 Tax=Pseudoxanthomonas kalamensis TaxID=289483 RepID=UPI001390A98A|nr:hypothetical protein [Pseudoxanthomonas kalamensis]KAF1712039.1 hypothetical protein CSC70_00445 [Pseudoxanthomonas kalamensis DSM 18571]
MPRLPLTVICTALLAAACRPSGDAALPATQPAEAGAAATAVAPATDPVADDPKQKVAASMQAFLGVDSFHAIMVMEGPQSMTSELDYVAPDRYRMSMPMGTQVIIGNTMYLQADGQKVTLPLPLPRDSLNQWRDPLKLEENRARLEVSDLGKDAVEGQPAHKYRVGHGPSQNEELTLWIAEDGLPLQLVNTGQAQGKPYRMTIRYGRYNDPDIRIDSP